MTDLSERAMLASLTVKQWSGRKTDKKISKKVTEDHKAERNAGRWNKQLLTCGALENFKTVADQCRGVHYRYTLPWLWSGAQILPVKVFPDYNNEMTQLVMQAEEYVEDFIKVYPDAIKNAEKRLGDMFDINDYPDVTTLKSKFGIDREIMPIPTGADWRIELADTERQELATNTVEQLKKAEAKAMEELWHRAYHVVNHVVDRLDKPETIFRDSLIGNISEMVDLMGKLNIADDPKMEQIKQEMELRLAAQDPQAIRDDSKERTKVHKAAADILNRMPYQPAQN